ncbi:MAG TPA: DinB family protein [Anaerolineales bacterium]|nr:DinB family protein [Anaerolineales bacterium]
MAHPLVNQLRFTRREWLRGLAGVSEEVGKQHFGPMNCISWTVGHLAWQEQRYWLDRISHTVLIPELNTSFAYGAPMSTPSLKEMRAIWHTITQATDPFLDSLTTEGLLFDPLQDGKSIGRSVGSAMHRMIYHYWYHIGEIQAIRQMLGAADLPEYVGDIETEAPYQPE